MDSFVFAKYDYAAQEGHELTITKNERLKVLDDSFNWWKSLGDRAKRTLGLGGSRSRSNIHQPDVDSSAGEARNPLNDPAASSSTHFGAFAKMPDVLSYAIAKFSYDPQRDDELRLSKGDHLVVVDKSSDGWWRGETDVPPPSAAPTAPPPVVPNANNGFGAASYGNGAAAYPLQNASFVNGSTGREQVLEVVVALYSFDAQNSEELSFRKGERLDIIDHPAYDPDWFKARNAEGAVGLVPTNYIEVPRSSTTLFDRMIADCGAKSRRRPPSNECRPKPYSSGPQLSGPYAQQPWYFGPLSREQSDAELNARGLEGDFLVRDSESNVRSFPFYFVLYCPAFSRATTSISLKGNIRNKHFWIQVDVSSGHYKIGNRSFPTMQALIAHYTKAPIFSSEETGERLYLVRPLPR
ncbi:hypothetical protein M3Y99_00061600 [Aphelenchoides fujianensis]|nr:hypothetical protein M3Y99_00061600 [Aphelenchoides fujianensis]